MKRAIHKNDLNVQKVLREFQKSEESPPHHKGTFKIDKPFDEALNTILKAGPEAKKTKEK
jgi:hypothetical protein